MAIAVHRSQHRVVHRSAWVRRRGAEPDALLAGLMLVLLLGGVVVLVAALDPSSAVTTSATRSWFSRTASTRPLEGSTLRRSLVTDTQPEMSSPATFASTPDAATTSDALTSQSTLAVGSAAHVAHTDGLGVVLHAAPSRDARMRAGLLEGAGVTVVETAGPDWARVQTETRQTGWVPTAFLATNE